MFFLYTITDSIQVRPEFLEFKNSKQLRKTIQDRYLFRIIQKEGLCVQVLNFTIKEAKILQQEGDIQICLNLELLIFTSFKDEILEGTITKNTPQGIYISLGFINAYIPGELLNQGSYYDEIQKIWIWGYEEFKALYYENHLIRFKTSKILLDKSDVPREFFLVGQCKQDGLGLVKWWSM